MDDRREKIILEALINFTEAKTVIEIGVQFGKVAVNICRAANVNGGHYTGFDVWNTDPAFFEKYGNCGSKEMVANKLTDNGLNCFNLIQIDTLANREQFKKLLDELFPNGIDFAFIDGNHSYLGIANDFFAVYPHLTPRGVIAFHDTAKIDGCREFILDLRTKYNDGRFDISDYPFGYGERHCGLTLLTKRSYPTTPISIDEICGSISDPHTIELNETIWYENEILNKPKMPEVLTNVTMKDRYGFKPQRQKNEIW